MDLNGDLVAFEYKKNPNKEWVFQSLKKYGNPVIVATDKKKIPSIVRKIAATFNARLFYPREDILEEEKEKLSSRVKAKFENLHERDAYAAARKAYNYFENKFRQAERIAKEHNVESEKLKILIIKNTKMAEGY